MFRFNGFNRQYFSILCVSVANFGSPNFLGNRYWSNFWKQILKNLLCSHLQTRDPTVRKIQDAYISDGAGKIVNVYSFNQLNTCRRVPGAKLVKLVRKRFAQGSLHRELERISHCKIARLPVTTVQLLFYKTTRRLLSVYSS